MKIILPILIIFTFDPWVWYLWFKPTWFVM